MILSTESLRKVELIIRANLWALYVLYLSHLMAKMNESDRKLTGPGVVLAIRAGRARNFLHLSTPH